MLLWGLCGILAVTATVLAIRLALLRSDLKELSRDFSLRLSEDTNVGLDSGSQDRQIRELAERLDEQLKLLRRERLKYQQGDLELKEAVTNISHDLRTPLTAICGYLELLEQEDQSEHAARYLTLIEGRVQAMKLLTEELFRYSLTAAGEEPLQLKAVDLRAAVEESVASFYGAFTGRGIVPQVRLPEKKVMRRVDSAALSRVLGNILNNALKYSGGDLEIVLEEDGTLLFSNAAPELSEVQVGRLFDRFFTVEAARNSTGLGLSIAKILTERMGGTVLAQYDQGRLCISLCFPEQI